MTQMLKAVHTLIEMLTPDQDEYGNVPHMLERIVQAAEQLFAPDVCAITAINPETGFFLLPPDPATAQPPTQPPKRPRTNGLTQYVLDHEALFVTDLAEHPEFVNRITNARGIQAFAAIALRTRPYETGLAVLYLNYHQPRSFTPSMQRLIEVFIDQASAALQQTWLIFRYAEVARIGQEINRQLDSAEAIFLKLATNIADIFDASYAVTLAIYQTESETLDFHIMEAGAYRFLAGEPFEGGSRWVIDAQQPLLIRQLSVEQPALPVQLRHLPNSDSREESLLFVPLIVGQTCLGVLSIQHPDPAFFDDEDLQVLRLLGNQTALAIHNLQLVNNLRQLNTAGQRLTQQLNSEQVLQSVVEQIHDITKADLVILYPYDGTTQRFDVPPRIGGSLREPEYRHVNPPRPDDIALLTVQHTTALYAEDSTTLYSILGGAYDMHRGSFVAREGIQSTAAVPLRVNGEPVGALFINFRHPQRFDASQRQLIEGLANYAAIAIANARAFEALLQQRVHQFKALRAIDRAISQTLELAQVLTIILDAITTHMQVDEAGIVLLNEQTGLLECPVAVGRKANRYERWSTPLDATHGIIHWVFQHKLTARVGDVHHEQPWSTLYIELDTDIQSEMDVPLIDGERVIGVINLESARPQAFSEEDQDFLDTLAEQAVLAIKNAQTYEREKRLADERQALLDINREITSQLDPARVFDLILTKALEVTNSSVGTLHRFDPERHDLYIVAERGVLASQKSRRIKLGEGIVGMAAAERTLLNVADVTAPPWQKIHIPDILSTRSELAAPLIEGYTLRGVLNIEHPEPAHFGPSDARLLLALADLAVITIQNAERYQQALAGRERLAAVHQVDQQILRQLDNPEHVIQTILTNALQLTRSDIAHLDISIGQSTHQTYAAHYDRATNTTTSHPVGADTPAGPPHDLIRQAVATRRLYRTSVVPRDAEADVAAIQSRIAVPLLSGSILLGVLSLESRQPDVFSGDDEHMLLLLANQAVIALQSARQYQLAIQAEQRMREAETMSSIGQAAFELAHRLGNDLGPIIPALNAIRRELERLAIVNPIITTNLERIAADKEQVTDLIKALKDELVALKEDDRLEHEPEEMQVRDLLEDAARAHPQLPATIHVQLDVETDVGAVRGIYQQISAILHNLFVNAVEAMPHEGTIILRARNAGQFVDIQVIDSGVGIPKEFQTRIFDLFVSTKASFGFGLWSARRNALANGGDLRVESQSGMGTTFTLTLRGATLPYGGRQ